MRRGFVLAVLLIAAQAQAITWNFDQEGDAQGWRARESVGAIAGNRSMLSAEVRDRIWRIAPAPFEAGRYPYVELVSPPIHRDSALFDRLTVRLRLVHTQPLIGPFGLTWTNEHNQSTPGSTTGPDTLIGGGLRTPLYSLGQTVTYTTQWQEVTLSGIVPGSVSLSGRRYEVIWDGDLIDLRIILDLGGSEGGYQQMVQGPEEVPEALEIDWIQLTGVEEQLQGELPPPAFTATTPFGDLFAPAIFCPLGTEGVGGVFPADFVPGGALGDLDGDGDLDLVARWEVSQTMPDQPPDRNGWLAAYNDGTGFFERSHAEQLFSGSPSPMLTIQGADLDGNGYMELVISAGMEWARVYANDPEDGLVVSQAFTETTPMLMDAEGDGDLDLYLIEYTLTEDRMESTDADLWLMRNEGGVFAPRVRIALAGSRPDFRPTSFAAQHLNEGRATGVIWFSKGQGYEITRLGADGGIVQEHLATELDPWLCRYIGDFDLDGDVDLFVSDNILYDANAGRQYKGLSILVNQGDGTWERSTWFPQAVLSSDLRLIDLNEDGLLDPVFVENDFRSPAVVVCLGMPGGLPVQEGRYPLSGTGGMVLAGDVDRDGDVDLVVLERSIQGQGGVHVLLNQFNRQGTAVLETDGQVPAAFHLGANYPNPFNPQTWIPLEIPPSAEAAHLRIYNLLGQPIRTLVSGRLAPGYHAVPWDGRDERGAVVSSGVYLYRLEAGVWRATGKMVKSE